MTESISQLAFKFNSVNDGASMPALNKKIKGDSECNCENYSVTWKKGMVMTDGVRDSSYPSLDFAEILALSVARFLSSLKETELIISSDKYKKKLLKEIIDSLNEYQLIFAETLSNFEFSEKEMTNQLEKYKSGSALLSAQITYNEKKNILRVFQKGNSRLAIFRKTWNESYKGFYYKLHRVLEEQQYSFNYPFQFLNHRDVCNVVDQEVFDLEIFEDDIIIAGSHSLFNNVFIGYLTHFVNFLIYLFFEDNSLSQESTKKQILTQIDTYMKYLQKGYQIFMKNRNSKEQSASIITQEKISIQTKATKFLENYRTIMTEEEILILEKTIENKQANEEEIRNKANSIMISGNEFQRYVTLKNFRKNKNSKIKTKNQSSESNTASIFNKKSESKRLKCQNKRIERESNEEEEELEQNEKIEEKEKSLYVDKTDDISKIFELPILTFIDKKQNEDIDKMISKSFLFTDENINFFFKTMDSKTFSQKIVQAVEKMFEIDQ
jgi:hypothetical protein